MSMMDNTIVTIAIPTMQHAFNADLHDVQWVTTVYMLTQAAVIPTAPYLTAKLGGKRAYVWTLTAFVLGSLLCGFAWNLPSLIVFRLIQGIGGGILLPMVMILLYRAFPAEERGLATSSMMGPLMIAPAFGPVLGGYLVTYLGWQWAFFINVPVGVVALAIALRILHRDQAERSADFDLPGFVAVAGGSAALLYGIASLPGTSDPLPGALALLTGMGFLTTFAFIETRRGRRGADTLLDLRRFRDATFTLSSLALILYTIVFLGVLFLLPIYLQRVHGDSPVRAGLIQAALSLATLALLPVSGPLSDRIGARPVSIAGVAAAAVAVGLMTTLTINEPVWMIVGMLALVGVGAAFAGQIQVAAMARIPTHEQQEVTNGATLVTVMRSIAAPIGVTLLAVLVQARSVAHAAAMAGERLAPNTLHRQASLLAMHDAFLLGAALAIPAAVLLWCASTLRSEAARDGTGEPMARVGIRGARSARYSTHRATNYRD
jgi:EmrB/QacA subfamily drug resistance transporter